MGRRGVSVLWLVLMSVALARPLAAQNVPQNPVLNPGPIPTPIQKKGLRVEIKEFARLPDTRELRPAAEDQAPTSWSRVSFVDDLPDGRRFANDSRGRLYVFDKNNQPQLYLDLAKDFPFGWYRNLQSGFMYFKFHPDFARNGLFYTTHSEKAPNNPAKVDFIPPTFTREDLTFETVITEWHTASQAANSFAGTKREMLRVGHVVNGYMHPLGVLEFNPVARPGSPDYGLLYIGGGETGFSNGGGKNAANPKQTQRLDTFMGVVLRLDPRSPSVSKGQKGVGDYTIPAINKFAKDGDPKTFGEIYAYGFRNPHRLSWDPTDGTLFASDIGMTNVEEVNIVHEGGNYGWMNREGTFLNGIQVPGGQLPQVYPLPPDILDGTTKDGFTYPVAMYDHGEGNAICAGFVYRGKIAALRGKFVFGDVNRGRVFATDIDALKKADDGIPSTVAPVEEVQLFVRDASGVTRDVTLKELVEEKMGKGTTRSDLHLSIGGDGELLVTTRQDGMIRMLVP